MEKQYNIDAARVYFVGHSNGGFMSHRIACDSAPRVAAIVSLAGATWKDQSKCQPAAPVAVLEVHGVMDDMVPYDGTPTQPGALETVADWATKNGCTGSLTATGQTLDLDTLIPGPETTVQRYNCAVGAAELWTMTGTMQNPAGHLPHFAQPAWGDAVWSFLSAHPKP
jgi:polyhydroxybutyrate depolymerase